MFNLCNRYLAGAAVGVAALSLLTACGGSDASADSCENAQVTTGITNSSSDALLFIADERGYFEEEGLDVEFVQFDSAAKMIAPLGGEQLDVAAGAPSAAFYNAVARDIDVRIVADKGQLASGYNYLPILVRKDLVESGHVTQIADLKGLKVAEPATATATSSMISTVLESANTRYADVNHTYVPFPDHIASFQNGSIDAAATIEPIATAAVESGAAVRMFDSTEVYNNQQIAVLLYSGQFSADRPAVAQCFMNAYVRAAEVYSEAVQDGTWNGTQGQDVASIISARTGIDPELFRKTIPPYFSPDASVNQDSLLRDYNFFRSQGLLESGVEADFSELVETRYLDGVANPAPSG
jgi:NitT/TauT family transport system substrate-binding protein